MNKHLIFLLSALIAYSSHAMNNDNLVTNLDPLVAWQILDLLESSKEEKEFTQKKEITASGIQKTKTLSIPTHDTLCIMSNYINVSFEPCISDEQKNKILISGDKNYLSLFLIKQDKKDSSIAFDINRNVTGSKDVPLKLHVVYYPFFMKELYLHNNVSITMNPQTWKNKKFPLRSLTAMDNTQAHLINTTNISSQSLVIAADGNARISCKNITTNNLELLTCQAAKIKVSKLTAAQVKVDATNNGTIKVFADKTVLNAEVQNNGRITYYGQPSQITEVKKGNGQIKQKAIKKEDSQGN